MKTFGRVLLSGWLLLFLTVGLVFAFPKPASRILHPIAPYFQVVPLLLLIGTATYGLVRIYRVGMKRLPGSK
jgi:hypothetical protein